MSKSDLRLEAIKLRQRGESVKQIAVKLGIAKSSASLWVRHVILTVEQAEKLRKRLVIGNLRGGLTGALVQKQRRLDLIRNEEHLGKLEFSNLSTRERQIAGLCLYWSEGSKKTRRVELCNSDPKMIKSYINWLESCYQISKHDLACYVGINEAHKHRESKIKEYWTTQTGISLENFTKTSFKKYPLKKIFENFNDHFGTLSVSVRKPARIFYKILGQIYGLSQVMAT